MLTTVRRAAAATEGITWVTNVLLQHNRLTIMAVMTKIITITLTTSVALLLLIIMTNDNSNNDN